MRLRMQAQCDVSASASANDGMHMQSQQETITYQVNHGRQAHEGAGDETGGVTDDETVDQVHRTRLCVS
jgi:hypothetical protein